MERSTAHASADDRDAVVALIAACQQRPERHVCYLSSEPEPIAAELDGLAPAGWGGVLVARRDERIVGALAVEHDTEPPRVWWHGPFVADGEDFASVGATLLELGRAELPASVSQEELGPDARHRDLADLAEQEGFTADPASAVLSRATDPPLAPPATEDIEVRPFAEADRERIAAIHDGAFPVAHVPGHRIDEGDGRWVLVARSADGPVGYIAVERHQDGSGYIDLVGVAPAARGRGVGAALVAAGVARVGSAGCARAHLTVREDNHVARRLYGRLGFTEERIIRPYRLGFSAV